MQMNVGIIGLGKMGFNLACNMLEKNIEVKGYDIDLNVLNKINNNRVFKNSNFEFYETLNQFVQSLSSEDALFLLVPHGE